MAGDKLSRDQNFLHLRQARPYLGARPYTLTHSMQCSQSCIAKSDDNRTKWDSMRVCYNRVGTCAGFMIQMVIPS